MVYFSVGAVFLFSVFAVACLVFPSVVFTYRDLCVGQMITGCRKFLKISRLAFILVTRSLFLYIASGSNGVWLYLCQNRFALSGGLVVIVMPPVLVMLLRGPVMLEGYEGVSESGSKQRSLIASLLHGERLVPPRTLPPQIFTSAEVERIRPSVSTADRSWERLDPEFMQRLLVVYKIMRDRHGYEMALLEGYRSPERQAGLPPNATNAAPGQSYHQYGLAGDSAFIRDGRLVISEKDAWAMRGYELYGQVAEEVGLTWGGRWKLLDYGHVELRHPGSRPPRKRLPE